MACFSVAATKQRQYAILSDRWGFPAPVSTTRLVTSARSSRLPWNYLAQSPRARINGLEASLPPKEAIHQFIEEIIERSLNDRERRGRFLINSALEVAPHDPELRALIADRLGEIETFCHRSIRAAQREGAVRSELATKDVSRLLLGLLGIRVLARAKPQRPLLEGSRGPRSRCLIESACVDVRERPHDDISNGSVPGLHSSFAGFSSSRWPIRQKTLDARSAPRSLTSARA
jgi:hypothetical protein